MTSIFIHPHIKSQIENKTKFRAIETIHEITRSSGIQLDLKSIKIIVDSVLNGNYEIWENKDSILPPGTLIIRL